MHDKQRSDTAQRIGQDQIKIGTGAGIAPHHVIDAKEGAEDHDHHQYDGRILQKYGRIADRRAVTVVAKGRQHIKQAVHSAEKQNIQQHQDIFPVITPDLIKNLHVRPPWNIKQLRA
jgi:hypothetical protein